MLEQMENGITLISPAKINLCLYVLGEREDGYHEIFSVMQAIELADTVELQLADKFSIDVFGADIKGENIVRTAWKKFSAATGQKVAFRVSIDKNIPIGAGLGGGSSNAAAFIRGASILSGLNLPKEQLIKIAAQVGSDVPFFLSKGTAIATGRGETIEEITLPLEYHILLIVPEFSISTKWAYSQIRNCLTSNDMVCNIKKYIADNFWATISELRNDFETVVAKCYPEISEYIFRLREMGARIASLTGSGSAVFAIFEDYDSAVNAKNSRWNGKTYLTHPVAISD